MAFVLDASVTIAFCLSDEADPYANRVLERLRATSALVPAIWQLEVANVLLAAERRRRLAEADTARLLKLLAGLPIRMDVDWARVGWAPVLHIAREYNLSSYDATYLELAMREGLPLATSDRQLGAAAVAAGVAIFN